MASRKTEPEPFPVRGTTTGYRDRWETNDEAIIEAQIAERERLTVAAREAAAPHRRGKRVAPGEPRQPTSPDYRIATDP
jgi:hypothetical protein